MNYEVFCFIYGNGCVQKEYFDIYAEALIFQLEAVEKYDLIDITPMNELAFDKMYR